MLEGLKFVTVCGHASAVESCRTTCGKVAFKVYHPKYRSAIVVEVTDGFDVLVPPEWPAIEEHRLRNAIIAA